MADEKEEKTEKTVTKAKSAGVLDQLAGNSDENGALTKNGQPVFETTREDD